jgi:hypothetical protein
LNELAPPRQLNRWADYLNLMRIIFRYSQAALSILMAVAFTVAVNAKNVPLRYTRRLPAVDKVELQKLKQSEMRIESIEATKILGGKQARHVAALWRGQRFRSRSPDCHYPAYGVKFYSRGKLVLYASLCWECDNIILLEPSLGEKQGFDGDSPAGKRLLELLKTSVP